MEYIPNGMKKVKSQLIEAFRYYVRYENDSGRFFEITLDMIQPYGSCGRLLDMEDCIYEIIDINGQEAF